MDQLNKRTYLSFRQSDLEDFARLSHDVNPMHLDPKYARKTVYGEPIVYGVLGGLACFNEIRRNRISGLTLEFRSPMYVDVEYQLEIGAFSERNTQTVELRNGEQIVAILLLEFENHRNLVSRCVFDSIEQLSLIHI